MEKVKGYSDVRLVEFRDYQSAYLLDSEEGERWEYYLPADKVEAFKAAGGIIE